MSSPLAYAFAAGSWALLVACMIGGWGRFDTRRVATVLFCGALLIQVSQWRVYANGDYQSPLHLWMLIYFASAFALTRVNGNLARFTFWSLVLCAILGAFGMAFQMVSENQSVVEPSVTGLLAALSAVQYGALAYAVWDYQYGT